MSLPARRLLLVHAHPDDETITTGATMARYAAEGAHVTLVTCTLGEEGEILVPALAGLAADQADQLGGYRIGELDVALKALGVTDQRFLGGTGRYRDSGMIATPQNDHPRAFWRAPVEDAAAWLADVIREVQPQVVVTYDPEGLYGHPDHIQAHRVTMRAIELAADSWRVAKVYYPSEPRSLLARGIETFATSAENPFAGERDVDALPFVTPDEKLGARIDGSAFALAKQAAMRAHATQVDPGTWLHALAENLGVEPVGVEYYIRAVGESGGAGLEDDLFAGL
ncbi:N-acetyl-1-D-myo-inositol-2-amino-2-deoxy-alpha-D-glucopyranoside deacetylase [Cryptosporangium arvum]|uniref:N-acetyl-1-D-myo-inositol-2-amino-2-deoxy-alpha- D-glucopyranoside deacetylase n=1 Tax=Cryptosporangium arvum TaxID=80871 RepID=UPI000A075DA2|nr:N-acetyl-1-D-myo-inositol-2-amino-2-deoxy-alpha-D-glucopyranoside deacetylase [Cryptosporangium arvum]